MVHLDDRIYCTYLIVRVIKTVETIYLDEHLCAILRSKGGKACITMSTSGSSFITMMYVCMLACMHLHAFGGTLRKVSKVIHQTARGFTSQQEVWRRQIINFFLTELWLSHL